MNQKRVFYKHEGLADFKLTNKAYRARFSLALICASSLKCAYTTATVLGQILMEDNEILLAFWMRIEEIFLHIRAKKLGMYGNHGRIITISMRAILHISHYDFS